MSLRPLILGAQGQVGHALSQLCRAQAIAMVGLGRTEAPLDDPIRLREALVSQIDQFGPAQIINAAAYTAVDRAESEPALASRVNTEALGVIGAVAAERGLPVVHYSTDYVFNGAKPLGQAYLPDDPVDPQSVYGRTKHAGEEHLLRSGARALIFRTSWVFSDHGANFLKTMLRLAQERETLKVVADQHGAPTSAAFIAQATMQALTSGGPTAAALQRPAAAKGPRVDTSGDTQYVNGHARIYHLTAAGQTTWHGFACALIAEARALRPDLAWKIRSDAQVAPITTAEYNAPAHRPQNSLLDCSATERDFSLLRSNWQTQMQAVLAQLL